MYSTIPISLSIFSYELCRQSLANGSTDITSSVTEKKKEKKTDDAVHTGNGSPRRTPSELSTCYTSISTNNSDSSSEYWRRNRRRSVPEEEEECEFEFEASTDDAVACSSPARGRVVRLETESSA